jgi:hypothetical protein
VVKVAFPLPGLTEPAAGGATLSTTVMVTVLALVSPWLSVTVSLAE